MTPPDLKGAIAALGPIIQIAFVPRDFDAALRFWTETIGAGPFFSLSHMPFTYARHRGRPIALDSSASLGYWGDLQIELLVQHDAGPSVYREWLDAGREGLHHVCIAVDDFEAAAATMAAAGGVPVHEAALEGAATAAYYELPGPGPLVEIAALHPNLAGLFTHMRAAHRNWDGSDPLRALPPEEEWRPGG